MLTVSMPRSMSYKLTHVLFSRLSVQVMDSLTILVFDAKLKSLTWFLYDSTESRFTVTRRLSQ